MANVDIVNFHMQYLDITSQHWNPMSEKYAGGDHLMTAIANGWDVERCVAVKHWYAGMRYVGVYHFSLIRDDSRMEMPVIHNPYIERFVKQNRFEVVEEDSNPRSA